jgi:GxxExxY protein
MISRERCGLLRRTTEALNAKDAKDAKDAKETRMAEVPIEDQIARGIIDAAMKVHSAIGPGMLESVYEVCLAHELGKAGFGLARQVPRAVIYDGVELDAGFRLDLLVDKRVIVEIKAVERIMPVHGAQLLSYLRLTGLKLGLLLNFNVAHMREGVKRVVNNL